MAAASTGNPEQRGWAATGSTCSCATQAISALPFSHASPAALHPHTFFRCPETGSHCLGERGQGPRAWLTHSALRQHHQEGSKLKFIGQEQTPYTFSPWGIQIKGSEGETFASNLGELLPVKFATWRSTNQSLDSTQ